MNNPLHIDFESRSALELPVVGTDTYSKHYSTDAWCMAWAFGDEDVALWKMGDPLPARIAQHVRDGGTVVGHNVAFELAIWNNVMVPSYGWPVLRPAQCRCTMAMAYAMALPGSLEKAAAAVGIAEQKDAAGTRVMKQLAKPKTIDHHDLPVWHDDPAKLEKLYEYCRQDVRVERELDARLMQLSNAERVVWELDWKINQRGIYVDRPAVEAAIRVVQAEADRLNAEMRAVTDNYVGFCTEVARLTEWVRSQGVAVEGLAKADVLDALALDGLPDNVRKALRLRQEAGKSSTAKLAKMLASVSDDGRLRGMFQYHGAGTGRWAGRKVQLQNLPRPKLEQDEIEDVLDELPGMVEDRGVEYAAQWIDNLYGSPLDVFSWALRGMLTAAPGHDLIGGDFANIEGRVLAWLAGEEWKLDAFRDYDAGDGPDLYLLAYSKSFGTSIEAARPHRQIGKVQELAFGFGGGVGAWRTMEKAYNPPPMTDEQVDDVKTRWRGVHPAIVAYWPALERAAMDAIRGPGTVCTAGAHGRQVKYRMAGSFLWCQLPSGRVLCYPYAKLKDGETSWGDVRQQIHYMTVDSVSNKWVETSTYGGKLAENVTQAVARDLLAEAMARLDNAGLPIVLHVHDEIVGEIKEATPARALDEFKRLMAATPAWAEGLPVAVEGFRRRRYGK